MPAKAPDPSEAKYLKATKHFAKRFGWWWREPPAKVFRSHFPGRGASHAAFVNRLFAAEFEDTARTYEIRRRLGREEGPAFPELPLAVMQHIAKRLASDDAGYEVCETTPEVAAKESPAPGWTRPLIATFNLRHSDETLVARFKEFLGAERKRLGMGRKPRSHQGKPTRPVSWKAVEHFDLKQHFDAHPKAKRPVDIDHSRIAKLRKT